MAPSTTASAFHATAGLLHEDAPGGVPSVMKLLFVDSTGLYRVESQVLRLEEGTVTEKHAVGTAAAPDAGAGATAIATNNARVRQRLLELASKRAENDIFRPFYPYGDQHETFDIYLLLDELTIHSKAQASEATNGSSKSSLGLKTQSDVCTQTISP